MGLLCHSAGLGEIRAPAPWDPFADIPDPAFAECAGFGRAVPDCSRLFFFELSLLRLLRPLQQAAPGGQEPAPALQPPGFVADAGQGEAGKVARGQGATGNRTGIKWPLS